MRMRVLVLGCGMMGSAIAKDMARSHEVSEVVVGDLDRNRVDYLVRAIASEKVSGVRVDVTDQTGLAQLMKGFNVATAALPHEISIYASKAAVKAGVHLVDLAYDEKVWELDEPAKKAGVTLIPGCGVAPGLTNILAGVGVNLLDEVDEVRLICGGIPQRPVPPLGYRIVFSPQTLVDMYCRRARIIRDGEVVEVETLSGLERIHFPGLGELEAFYTDGLSTLLRTMRGRVRNMYEKTARWPGHAEKIETLRRLGFFDEEPIQVDGVNVVPRRISIALLSRALGRGERDVTVLRVDVKGRRGDERITHSFIMVDFYDEKEGVTSMARTTGFTASIVSRMVADGTVQERGVVPPELAVCGERFERLVSELSQRGIRIRMVTVSEREL